MEIDMAFVAQKNYLLMKEVITKYHPMFQGKEGKKFAKIALNFTHAFNCERLVEETIASVGGYDFVDEAHKDFNCKHNSDLKTCSIGTYSSNGNSFRGEVSGVITAGGSMKSGALRCIVYNPHYESLMYYFLPKKFWQKELTINRHPSSNVGRIFFSYNRKQNYIPTFYGHECKSFEELAKK